MRALSERWKPITLLLCLVLVALFLTALRTRGSPQALFFESVAMSVVLPLQQTLGTGFKQVSTIWHSYVNLVQVRQENMHLQDQVRQLQGELHRYQEAYSQHQRLRELLGFREAVFPRAVAAEVVGIDPSQWSEAVTINRGSGDTLGKDAVVVTHTGLVGRVIAIAPHYATVLLITDRRSAVDALIQRTRARGIVVGKSRRTCELRYVDFHADVQVGDAIISSGLGGVYPKGLLIGKVVSVHPKPYGLFHEVEVQPVVDLAKLEEVLVLAP